VAFMVRAFVARNRMSRWTAGSVGPTRP